MFYWSVATCELAGYNFCSNLIDNLIEVFQALVHMLCEKQLLIDSRSISVEEQVAIFLYTIAKNVSNETLQYEF